MQVSLTALKGKSEFKCKFKLLWQAGAATCAKTTPGPLSPQFLLFHPFPLTLPSTSTTNLLLAQSLSCPLLIDFDVRTCDLPCVTQSGSTNFALPSRFLGTI